MSPVDLSVFEEANARPKRLPWEKRVELIESQFPNVRSLDWKKAFDENLDLFAWIMQDILKVDAAQPGRDGPKPRLDLRTALPRFRQLMGDDYSMLPFQQAFEIMVGDLSLSGVARKTGLSRSTVHRLLSGEKPPTAYEMEQIAKGFRRQPGHFKEYRLGTVIQALWERMNEVPESSVKFYAALAPDFI